MKQNNTLKHRIKIFIAFILLLNLNSYQVNAQIGASCPPCTAEQTNLINANNVLIAANSSLSNAESSVSTTSAALLGAIATFDVAAAAAAATCAVAWYTPACATALAAVVTLEIAVAVALLCYNNALDGLATAETNVTNAQLQVNQSQNQFDECMARGNPGICKKCSNGTIVADDSHNPGICKKCENGSVVNDDTEDPGSCKKCENGEVVNDCLSGQQCCNGVCKDIEYEYYVTVTTVSCDGSNSTSYYSSSCSSGSTGVLNYSFGVCVGGSIVTITCSGPTPLPCP